MVKDARRRFVRGEVTRCLREASAKIATANKMAGNGKMPKDRRERISDLKARCDEVLNEVARWPVTSAERAVADREAARSEAGDRQTNQRG